MKFTENYRLGSVSAGDPLDPVEDARRMGAIDRQLLGLFQVLGNGIVSGWELLRATGLTVNIAPGNGHVQWVSLSTSTPYSLAVQPNSVNYVYVARGNDSAFTGTPSFYVSGSKILDSNVSVYLGSVTTNATGVLSIDSTDRVEISFLELVKQAIAEHRHRGGNDDPERINLQTDVSGQLPGYRIAGIDASQVVSGTVPAARLPALEHSALKHSGVLTHAQLDSFVRNLSNPNTRLLGELAAVNLLQVYLATKHIWNDVDEFSTNMLTVIPGITRDDFSDYGATTAIVDLSNHTVQGIKSESGTLHTVSLSTESDFQNVFAKVNVDVTGSGSDAAIRLTRPTEDKIVEDFDNIFASDSDIPGWTVTTSALMPNDTSFKTDSFVKDDGAFSGKWRLDQGLSVQTAKKFEKVQDWSQYNVLEIAISCLSSVHGQVRLKLLGDNDEVLDDFILLLQNETTKGFKKVSRDISAIDRSEVHGISIYTDTSVGWDPAVSFEVNVDSIVILNTLSYDPAGYLRIRMQTPQNSRWTGVSWDAELNGGQISARARTASSYSSFDQGLSASFGVTVTQSGGDLKVPDGTAFELELALSANSSGTASPMLRSMTINYITQSNEEGIAVRTPEDFLISEKLSNVKVTSDADSTTPSASVSIDGRIDVGDVVYGLLNSVQQSTYELSPVPVRGVIGTDLFISPWQAASKDLRQRYIRRKTGLDGVMHVSRLDDRTYLVADTLNDRVLLLASNGKLLKGLVTNNVRNEEELYPITCIINPRTKVLYVAWSRNVSINADLTKFVLNSANLSVTLNNKTDAVQSISGLQGDQGKSTANVLAVSLGESHWSEIDTYLQTQGQGAPLYLQVEPDAVADGINVSSSNYATLAGPRGLPVAVADVAFVPGIHRPISAAASRREDRWIVANAKPVTMSSDGTDPMTGIGREEIVSVIEYDIVSGEAILSDDSVDFSLATLGGVTEMGDNYWAVAGISPDDQTSSSVSSSSTNTDGAQSQVFTDYAALSGYRGRVMIIEKKSGRSVYDQMTSEGTFASDVQVDSNGNLLVVERWFVETESAGFIPRGRLVKLDEDGNVFWQYGAGLYEGFTDARILENGNVLSSS